MHRLRSSAALRSSGRRFPCATPGVLSAAGRLVEQLNATNEPGQLARIGEAVVECDCAEEFIERCKGRGFVGGLVASVCCQGSSVSGSAANSRRCCVWYCSKGASSRVGFCGFSSEICCNTETPLGGAGVSIPLTGGTPVLHVAVVGVDRHQRQGVVLNMITSTHTLHGNHYMNSTRHAARGASSFLTLALAAITAFHAANAQSLDALRQRASQGDATAQVNLGTDYYFGTGVDKDHIEAVRWFRRAAEQGDADSQVSLGFMYTYGFGVEQDHAEAVRWYRRAAEQGDDRGQNNLGDMYRHGLGVEQDYEEAVRWYRLAAYRAYEANALALKSLGDMYRHGLGVEQDYEEAVSLYRWSIESDFTGTFQADAQNSLGDMFRDGLGVAQDYGEAVSWYRLAAEHELLPRADAQNSLGDMYRGGLGVEQDYEKAVHWYQLAARQGDEDAQYNLGAMYDEGEGVPESDVDAHAWYSLARISHEEIG